AGQPPPGREGGRPAGARLLSLEPGRPVLESARAGAGSSRVSRKVPFAGGLVRVAGAALRRGGAALSVGTLRPPARRVFETKNQGGRGRLPRTRCPTDRPRPACRFRGHGRQAAARRVTCPGLPSPL